MLRGSSGPSKNNPSRRSRYPNSTILLYWLVLLLVVATYAYSLLRENVERGSDLREGLKAWRFMLGLTVLAATFLCASLRVFIWTTPPITPDPPRLLHWLSIAARLAIYLWLVAMPLAGWTILSAEGDAIPLWGLNLPPLTGVNKQLAHQVQKLHETGGTVGNFLLATWSPRSCGAVPPYTLRENTRRRMLPGQGR